MAVALETFVKHLTDSGIIAPGKLESFLPPKAVPKDAQELARQLVQSKQLTKYQAAEIYQGRARYLILGNYTILDKIGAGGMGQVFKAEHRRMHRIVAIKMLPKAMMKDAATIARFEREVTAAAKLRHPNIVAADDADEAGGVHFLVMEYIEGSDLSALVKKNGPFPVAKAVNYILQAARGLEFAHKKGVIHRDIKPANLLLDADGTVKILDMGLARIEAGGDAATQAELTGTGAVMGTVDYMAPEQALSTKHAEARSDIYSLGCTLYYLIAGKPTYDGDSLMAKLLAHRETPIPSLAADVPEQVQAIFEKMIAKNADDRYQTMSEVVADLQDCVSGGSTVGGSKTSVESSSEISSLSFLQDAPSKKSASHTAAHRKTTKPATGAGKGISNRGKLAIVGGGLLALIVLAGILLKIRTKDGTLVVEIDQPDATVEVLNDDGKVEITQPGGKGTISISIDPGKHRLKIEKDGFAVFGQDFVIEAGGNQSIKAHLDEDKPWYKPAFRKWETEVAAMPAEEQVNAVSKKLMELNRGFDGKLAEQIEAGVVTAVSPVSDHLIDISPLRAFSRLKTLQLLASDQQVSQLADLSPLSGMPLTQLKFASTPVSDLTPLKGMKLTLLHCPGSKVRALSPLIGMPLTSLKCSDTQVSDLSPLRGMPLVSLDIDGSQVSDLSPLEGMPLTSLNCHNSPVSDLSPLAGMPLGTLQCGDSKVADLKPLKGMPLTILNVDRSDVGDLSPLRGMPLTAISLDKCSLVTDISPLNGMPLTYLHLGGTNVTRADVAALRKTLPNKGDMQSVENANVGEVWESPAFQKWEQGVAALSAEEQIKAVSKKLVELNPGFDGKETHDIENGVVTGLAFDSVKLTDLSPVRALVGLKSLACINNSILSTLSPLKGAKLTALDCSHTQVNDLTPLSGMPLASLTLIDTPVSDLTPLGGMRLTRLNLDHTQVRDLSPLAGMRMTHLLIDHTGVVDLSPIAELPLAVLHCRDTQISDLKPVAGMPCTELYVDKTAVADLSPLAQMKLQSVLITPANITKGMNGIRQMSSLTVIGSGWAESNRFPAAEFWRKYDAGEFGKPESTAAATPDDKPVNTYLDPSFKKWEKKVAALPAEEQVNAVVKKLQELNPGFDGKAKHEVEGGVVTKLYFDSDQVADISPVRVLKSLGLLACSGNGTAAAKLSDLSPLKGLPLGHLYCSNVQVSDLSPLAGMPLTILDCARSSVSDLSPLQGMKLTNLSCRMTKVSDLSPLRGMPLTELACWGMPISDLSPLRGMKLTNLNCCWTQVSDLAPIEGMPLASLTFNGTPVSDLTPLQGMNLAEIWLTPKNITKGMNVIRTMTSLKAIGQNAEDIFAPAEFWKKYDAGDLK